MFPDTQFLSEKVDAYTVQANDTLWSIAAKPEVYGSGWKYPLIIKANKEMLRNPNNLKVGSDLQIPRDYSKEEEEAAKEALKNSRRGPPEHRWRRELGGDPCLWPGGLGLRGRSLRVGTRHLHLHLPSTIIYLLSPTFLLISDIFYISTFLVYE